jgi:GNAT superfamily N-acetyltransferase
MRFRFASVADAESLGTLNAQLIRDEGHRNSMTAPQLVERMTGWLRGDYQAVIVEHDDTIAGYVLFRRDPDHIYVRQIFVQAEHRRQGVGRALVQWAIRNAWHGAPRIRIEVLVGNAVGREFWRALGFRDYCIAMEMEFSRES